MPFTMVNIVKTWPSTHGRPLSGEVTLTPDAPFRNGTDWSAASYAGQVSSAGRLSIQVPATDDSGTTPAGVRYRVVEQVPGVVSRPHYIAVPAAAGTIDLGTVTKLDSPSSAGRGAEPVTRSELADAVAGAGSGGGATYTDEQSQDATAAAFAAGSHTGATVTYNDAANSLSVAVTDPLPEFASTAQTAAVTASGMVRKLTRYDTSGGTITQPLPAATAGAAFAVGWDAGTNALTLTAAGSDVIGSGVATSVTVPLVGEVLTYHCTTAGRWRVVAGFKTQAALDARLGAGVLLAGVGDGVAVDTSAINAALTSARLAGGGQVKGRPGAVYLIDAPLVIGTGTTLDMIGCTVRLKEGSNCNMVQNYAAANLTRTAAGAAITAASKTLTATGGAFTSADVGRSVVVPNAAGGNRTAGAGTTIGNLTATITAVTNSTTVEVSVAAGTTVSGKTVSIYTRDHDIIVTGGFWERQSNQAGTDDNRRHSLFFRRVDGLAIHPQRITATGGKYLIAPGDCTAVRITCPIGNTPSAVVQGTGPLRDVRVWDVSGTTSDDMVAFGTGDYESYEDVCGTISDVVVEDINPVNTATVAVKFFTVADGETVQRVSVERIGGTCSGGAVVTFDNGTMSRLSVAHVTTAQPNGGYAVQFGTNFDCADVRQIFGSGGSGVVVQSNVTTGGTLIVRDLLYAMGVNAHGVRIRGSLQELAVTGFNLALNGGNSYLVSLAANAAVARLRVAHGSISAGGGFVSAETTPVTLGQVILSDVQADGSGWIAALAGTHVVHLNNATISLATAGSFGLYNSANVVVRGGDGCNFGTSDVSSGTYTLAVRAPDFPLDIIKVNSRTAGDRAYNTAVARACGVGPVMWTGTVWQNLATGATYTP